MGTHVIDPLRDARCLECSYSLRGLDEPRCPECGRLFDPNDARTMAWSGGRYSIAWQSLVSLILILPPLCVPSLSKMAGVEFLVPAFGSIALGFGIALSGVRSRTGWNRWFCALTLLAHAFIIWSMANYLVRRW